LALLRRHGLPHLVIVDIKVARQANFDFCRQIKQFTDLPVIILITQDDTSMSDATGCASVDFLNLQPLKPLKLLAHIQRILQKFGKFAYLLDTYITIDHRLQVNLATQQAVVNGQDIMLTATENKILHILIRDAGQIVTSRVLLEKLALTTETDENGLNVHITSLRHKLESNPSEPKYILNRAGIGYYFMLN
jgi:DNA-binding response OmpR family regulator